MLKGPTIIPCMRCVSVRIRSKPVQAQKLLKIAGHEKNYCYNSEVHLVVHKNLTQG